MEKIDNFIQKGFPYNILNKIIDVINYFIDKDDNELIFNFDINTNTLTSPILLDYLNYKNLTNKKLYVRVSDNTSLIQFHLRYTGSYSFSIILDDVGSTRIIKGNGGYFDGNNNSFTGLITFKNII